MDECPLYADPELYDLLFPNIRENVSGIDETRRQRILASECFYLEEAQRSQGCILELGCGSGRLTVPIAEKGLEIVGLDLSGSMLEAARVKAAAAGVQVQFIQGDMRNFALPGHFSTILMAGNSMLHLLSVEELQQCLASVRRHLGPGGRFVLDIFNPDVRALARDPERRYPLFTIKHPKRGEISLEESASYEATTQVRSIRWYFSSPDARDFYVFDYALRVIFPQELLLLLKAAGFRLEARYGEFTRETFASSSPRQLCICSVC